jgi:hypothetical protein
MTEHFFPAEHYVDQYLKQHIRIACIRFDSSDSSCAKIIEIMATVFWASNPRLKDEIELVLSTATESDLVKRKRTWRRRIRKACALYCRSVYDAMDLAEIFFNAQDHEVDCKTAYTNKDCFTRASSHARIRAAKNRKMTGFLWFAEAV